MRGPSSREGGERVPPDIAARGAVSRIDEASKSVTGAAPIPIVSRTDTRATTELSDVLR